MKFITNNPLKILGLVANSTEKVIQKSHHQQRQYTYTYSLFIMVENV